MDKKKGIALVMTIFFLAFFLAIGLNMFFVSIKNVSEIKKEDRGVVLDEEYDIAYYELDLAVKEVLKDKTTEESITQENIVDYFLAKEGVGYFKDKSNEYIEDEDKEVEGGVESPKRYTKYIGKTSETLEIFKVSVVVVSENSISKMIVVGENGKFEMDSESVLEMIEKDYREQHSNEN